MSPKQKSKIYSIHAEHSYFHPVNQHWDACAPCTQVPEPYVGKSSGLVTHRSLMDRMKQDKDSWVFASPVYTRYPLMLQLGGLLPQLTPGPVFKQLDRLEQCEQNFLLKETTATPK